MSNSSKFRTVHCQGRLTSLQKPVRTRRGVDQDFGTEVEGLIVHSKSEDNRLLGHEHRCTGLWTGARAHQAFLFQVLNEVVRDMFFGINRGAVSCVDLVLS